MEKHNAFNRKRYWTAEEDDKLRNLVNIHGACNWASVSQLLGRSGNSCRDRWVNYLSPEIVRSNFTDEEMLKILKLRHEIGNRWSSIAKQLPGRTANDIKNFCNTRMKDEARQLNCDIRSEELFHVMTERLMERIQAKTTSTLTSESIGGAEIQKDASSDVHKALISNNTDSDSAYIPEGLSEGPSADKEKSDIQEDRESEMPINMQTVESELHGEKHYMVSGGGGSELIPSESTEGAEIRKEKASHVHGLYTSPEDSDSVSISEDLGEERSTREEESETWMPKNMPISVRDLIVDSGSYGEIQVLDIKTTTGGEDLHIQQRDVITEFVLKEKHYMFSVEEDHMKLKLDHQTILIEDIRSSTRPEYSPKNAVVNLIEHGLRQLPEKSDYGDSFVMFLQKNYQLTLIHDSYFDSMPDLQFLDLSDTRIRNLPSSLYRLPKLKVLMLSNCAGLENLPSEIGKLNQVEVLDLSGTTEVYSLPDEIGQLVLLKSMKLSFYGPDNGREFARLPSQLVSPSIFSKLQKLQALGITVHPEDHRWTNIASQILEEVGKLEMLSYFQFYFPKVEIFEEYIQTNPSWNKRALTGFNFIVGRNVKQIASRVPDEVELLFGQQEKCLRFVNGDKVTELIKTALIQVTAFYLDHHTEIQSFSEFGISNFKALKLCVVSECPKIQAITDEKTDEDAFPCLEYLGVYYLWELRHIWKRMLKTPVPFGHFKALKCLVVITCPKLRFILWGSMLQYLSNMEELVVKDCKKVEKIIKDEKKKVKYDEVVLPGLTKLVLHYLPNLVSLGNGLRLSEEKVDVLACPKLILEPLPQ